MMPRLAVCEQSQLLDELLLHQDRVQVRVGPHHRLQEGAMAAAVEEEETRKGEYINSDTYYSKCFSNKI